MALRVPLTVAPSWNIYLPRRYLDGSKPMPAWRLGRHIGSLLLLAALAVSGFAAATAVTDLAVRDRSGHIWIADSTDPPAEGDATGPEAGVQVLGWDWT
ncbi:hypothetical protein GCM10027615_05270 [Plantactinospora veratri]